MTTHLNDTDTPMLLDTAARQWVDDTLARLNWDDKLRQLFCLLAMGDAPGPLEQMMAFRPGAVMRAPWHDAQAACDATQMLQTGSTLPLLVAGDLEGGVTHPAVLGELPSALAVAAANDPGLSFELYQAAARLARSVGFNWTFAPVLDINTAWRSAIVGTRSYGSNPDAVLAHALAYVRAMQSQGIACTAKHWPGEGQDDRDQHLVTTVNPQSPAEWEQTYGRLYRALIDAGVMSVMSAHITLPGWPQPTPQRPASINAALNQGLLRGHLGFRGLVVSDATLMAGLSGALPRAELVPAVIESGCDVLLFSPMPEADLAHLRRALESGRLSEARVNDALRRQLSMKAALGLHHGVATAQPGAVAELATQSHLVDRVAAGSVTLVKQAPAALPINARQHRRVLVLEQPGDPVFPGAPAPSIEPLLEALRARGFEPRRHAAGSDVDTAGTDLLLYVITQESALTLGRVGIDWRRLHGEFPWSMHRWWHELPTVMVSFGHPYLLYDAPQVPTYINAYTAVAATQRAVVAALTGEASFSTFSPIDPWCGLPKAAFD